MGRRRSGPAALVYVGVAEKTEATSLQQPLIWTELKFGWDCDDDVTDDVADDEENERLQTAGGEAAMLTNPVNRLRRGSAHRPPPLETDVEGSKVKRPL